MNSCEGLGPVSIDPALSESQLLKGGSVTREISFGNFSRELNVHLDRLSYNEMAPPVRLDAAGNEIPHKPPALAVGSGDIYRLLKPYLSVRFFDQFKAVAPLAVYLVLFQLFILGQAIEDSLIISGGLVAVIFGLMLFMEGLKVGLMPFGESLGISLPAKASLIVVLLVVFLLGIGAPISMQEIPTRCHIWRRADFRA